MQLWLLRALITLSILICAPAFAQQDPAAVHASSLVKELKNRGNILTLGPALQLADHIQWLSSAQADAVLKDALAAKPHPLASAILQRLRAQQLLRKGDRDGAQQVITAQGFLTDWLLLGPFPNDGMSALSDMLPPEQRLELDAPTQGRNASISWRRLHDADHLGVVDLETLIRPVEQSAAFATTTFRLAKQTTLTLRVTASAAYTLWVDGARVATVPEDPGGNFDRDTYQATLEAGDHIILIKFANDDGPLSFSVRVTNPDGAPIPAFKTSAKPDAIKALIPRTPGEGPMFAMSRNAAFSDAPGPLSLFLDATKKLNASRRAVALSRAALIANFYRPDDTAEPSLEFLRQAESLPADPQALLLASALYPLPWQQHNAINSAISMSQTPWVRFRHCQLSYNSTGEANRTLAGRSLAKLIADHPSFLAPRLLQIEFLIDENLLLTAWKRAKALIEDHPDHPLVLQAALRAAEAVPGNDLIPLYEQRLKVDASDISIYGPLSTLLIKAGRSEDARALIHKAIKLRPDITGFLGLAADIERSLDKDEEALSLMQKMANAVPGDASYWSRLGTLQAELGLTNSAATSLERAIAIEPQNVPLKEFLDYLAPQEADVDEAFAVEVAPPSSEKISARFPAEDYVYLLDQKVTRVFPNGLSSSFIQRAFKIRTEQGVLALRNFYIPYTPGDEVVSIRLVRVIRDDGTVRETFLQSEESMSEPWYNLYYDYRALVLTFPDLAPGDTVEVRYKISQTASTNIFGDYFGDLWFFEDNAPKLRARYTLITPTARDFQIRAPSNGATLSTSSISSSEGDLTARSWERLDVPAVKSEPGAPGFSELADYIHVSTYRTWDELSVWYWNLIKEQLVVDSELREIVKKLTKDLSDDRDKVAAIHNFVVKNTRYVALEFGIHGYKPYRTTLCYRRRFGDCKDKASLLKVMLEQAGITANIVLVRTRNSGAVDSNPASLKIFDHAITYVPRFKLFLDGTAEYSGTNELPWGDQGVQVLIVEDGGSFKFTKTPILPADINAISSRMEIDLTRLFSSGETSAVATTTVSGLFAASYRSQYQSPESQLDTFSQSLVADFPGANVSKVAFSDLSKLEDPVQVDFSFTGAQLAKRQGDDIVFLPAMRPANLAPRLASRATRKFDLILGHPYTDEETYDITLPPSFVVQRPDDVSLETPFGSFSLSVKQQQQRVSVSMKLAINVHRISAADYPEFRRWLEAIDNTLISPIIARPSR